MSTPPLGHPPTPHESKPPAWLSFAWPVFVYVAGLLIQWGALSSDSRNLERRVTSLESQVSATAAAQAAAREDAASLKTEMAGMRREMERLTRAVERLTDPAHARR